MRVHIEANGASLLMDVETPEEEAFLESFIEEYGVPRVRTGTRLPTLPYNKG